MHKSSKHRWLDSNSPPTHLAERRRGAHWSVTVFQMDRWRREYARRWSSKQRCRRCPSSGKQHWRTVSAVAAQHQSSRSQISELMLLLRQSRRRLVGSPELPRCGGGVKKWKDKELGLLHSKLTPLWLTHISNTYHCAEDKPWMMNLIEFD